MRIYKVAMISFFCLIALAIGGCASNDASVRIDQASRAYNQNQFQRSYQLSSYVAQFQGGWQSYLAAYYAGLSAEKLNHLSKAEHYLLQAMRSDDTQLSGSAAAALGLLYSKYSSYQAAQWAFNIAAHKLKGEEQARALFYEAIAQQKLGARSTARANLIIARGKTNSTALKNKISEQMSVTGYTIQVGAYADSSHAQKAAQQWAKKVVSLNIGMPRLVKLKTNDSNMVLVQIGEFTSYESANDAKKKLHDNSAIIATLAN